jgi:Rrf2 family nitric oxide-sensitive transcriptional repressor
MRLTRYTDYGLRTLIYLGLKPEGLSTVPEIAGCYGISEHHLTKIVGALAHLGHIRTVRGRNGGFSLARKPEEINLGALVRSLEDNFDLVECFQASGNSCPLTPCCPLSGVLREAMNAFLAVLERYTLADIMLPAAPMARALSLDPPSFLTLDAQTLAH